MRFIALDVHPDFCEVAIAEDGEVRLAGRVETKPAALELFAPSLGADDQVALDATGNALAIARVIEPHVAWVVLANPKAVTGATQTAKTDQLDACTLASLPCRWLPEAQPAKRDLRSSWRERYFVSCRSSHRRDGRRSRRPPARVSVQGLRAGDRLREPGRRDRRGGPAPSGHRRALEPRHVALVDAHGRPDHRPRHRNGGPDERSRLAGFALAEHPHRDSSAERREGAAQIAPAGPGECRQAVASSMGS
jgi:hypothetical protein